jgi:hypothetical protein
MIQRHIASGCRQRLVHLDHINVKLLRHRRRTQHRNTRTYLTQHDAPLIRIEIYCTTNRQDCPLLLLSHRCEKLACRITLFALLQHRIASILSINTAGRARLRAPFCYRSILVPTLTPSNILTLHNFVLYFVGSLVCDQVPPRVTAGRKHKCVLVESPLPTGPLLEGGAGGGNLRRETSRARSRGLGPNHFLRLQRLPYPTLNLRSVLQFFCLLPAVWNVLFCDCGLCASRKGSWAAGPVSQ